MVATHAIFDAAKTFVGAIVHVVFNNEGHRTEAVHVLQRLGLADLPKVDHALGNFTWRGM